MQVTVVAVVVPVLVVGLIVVVVALTVAVIIKHQKGDKRDVSHSQVQGRSFMNHSGVPKLSSILLRCFR